MPEFVWPKNVIIDNITFDIRNTPYSFGIKYMLSRNQEVYESSERSFLEQIDPGEKVLEMGSSIGILTRLISERVGPNGNVLAVEASTKLTSYSSQWLEKQSNIKVVCRFAFPIYHRIPFRVRFDDTRGSLGGTIHFEEGLDIETGKDKLFIEDVEQEFGFRPSTLVCDIEGSEITLLHHDATLPDYLNKIIIELHPDIYTSDKALQIIQKIKDLNYNLEFALHSVYMFKRKVSNTLHG